MSVFQLVALHYKQWRVCMGITACVAAERDSLTQERTEVTCSRLVFFVLSEAVVLLVHKSEYTVTLTTV